MKVNDVSLMYTARDAFWRDHQLFTNEAAHVAAHESSHGSEHCYERSPIPIACRIGACDGPYSGTISRESPHYYHYAQLPDPRTNTAESFYVRPEVSLIHGRCNFLKEYRVPDVKWRHNRSIATFQGIPVVDARLFRLEPVRDHAARHEQPGRTVHRHEHIRT